MSVPNQQLMTVDELVLIPDDGKRYELIEGELFATNAPNLDHQVVIGTLTFLIGSFLKRRPIGLAVFGPGVILSKISSVIPDVVFVTHETCKRILAGGHLHGAPELAIEVISPSAEARRRDRVAKRHLFGKYGVREYWIVDHKHRSIEIYELDGHTLVLKTKLEDGDTLTSSVLPGFSCDVAVVFANID